MPESIESSFLWNGEKEGTFRMLSENNVSMRGIVYSTSPYVHCMDPEFDGNDITIRYQLKETEFYPGDTIKGAFVVVYNRGEARIPFCFTFHKKKLESSEGEIRSLDEFLRLAQNNRIEAMQLFYSMEFRDFIRDVQPELSAVFRGFANAVPSAQNFENFLVASGKKRGIDFDINCNDTEIYDVKDDWQGKVNFTKSNWGFLEIKVTTEGDFFEINHPVISDTDFLGREYIWSFIIKRSALHRGRNQGRMIFSSGRQTKEIVIRVSPDSEERVDAGLVDHEKEERISLINDYFEMRLGRVSARDFANRLIRITEKEREQEERRQEEKEGFLAADLSPWYHLLIVYGHVLLHEKQEALYLIRDLKNEIEDRHSAEWAFLLYLCTRLESDEEYLRRLREEIEKIFRLNPEDMRIFLMLLDLRPEYRDDPAKKLKDIRHWIMNGYRSPFLLYEGYELYRRNPFLLSEIDSFSRLILLFIYRKNAFTRELGMQLTEVMIHEHLEFDPNILRILKRCYETYTENDLLEQIILYMMNHEKYDGESALWYKKGIDQELRINGLYEAYICSIPMEEAENLPEEIKLFFRYPNQLNYERKAMLYALVVSDRIRDSRTYREYVPSIDSFLREQASMQRLDENLAILYQNALDHHLLTAETSVQLSHLFFVNKLVVVRPQAVRVIYYSDALKEPLMAPIVNRIAYLPVPDRNGQIYLEDADGSRYLDSNLYYMTQLLSGPSCARELKMVTDRPLPYIIHELSCMNVEDGFQDTDLDNIEYLLSSEEVRPEYLKQILPRISILLKRNGREDLLNRFLWEHREDVLEDSELRSQCLSFGIMNDYMEEAYELLQNRFVLKIPKNQILRLLNNRIRSTGAKADDFLIAMCAGLMMNDGYSETTIAYLNQYFTGPVEFLRKLFELTEEERMDNAELAGRTLIMMMYQDERESYPSRIWQAYLRHQPNRMVAEAFLTFWSHEYLHGGIVPDASFFATLIRMCRVEDDTNESCKIALMRYLCERVSLSEEEYRILEQLLRYHIVRNVYFAFYKKADYRLTVKFHLYDKTFIEYHGNPGEEVTLVWHRPGQKDVTERMQEMYSGIYVRQFVLFFGDSIEYEIYIESHDLPVVRDRIVGQELLGDGQDNCFQMLNRLQSDYIYGNVKDLKTDMVEYDKLKRMTTDLFFGL